MFAGQGYVVAVQDVRGKFDSEGHFTLSANDTGDGSGHARLDRRAVLVYGEDWHLRMFVFGRRSVRAVKVKNPHHTAMIPQAAAGPIVSPTCAKEALWAGRSRALVPEVGQQGGPAPEVPKVDLEPACCSRYR